MSFLKNNEWEFVNMCIAVNREKLANIQLSYSFTNAIFREIRKQFSKKKKTFINAS